MKSSPRLFSILLLAAGITLTTPLLLFYARPPAPRRPVRNGRAGEVQVARSIPPTHAEERTLAAAAPAKDEAVRSTPEMRQETPRDEIASLPDIESAASDPPTEAEDFPLAPSPEPGVALSAARPTSGFGWSPPPPADPVEGKSPELSRSPAESEGRLSSDPERRKAPSALARVRMAPGAGQVAVGDLLPVRILIRDGADVASVPFHVQYNPDVLRFDGGEEGDFLKRSGRSSVFLASPGARGDRVVVGLSLLGGEGAARGQGELCTLHFRVIGPGSALFSFLRASVRDPANRVIPAVFEPASVEAR